MIDLQIALLSEFDQCLRLKNVAFEYNLFVGWSELTKWSAFILISFSLITFSVLLRLLL